MKLSRIAGYTAPLFIVLFLLVFTSLTAQNSYRKGNSDTQNIQTFVLNSFEKQGQWKAEFSMYASKKYDSGKKRYQVDIGRNDLRLFPGKPWGVSAANEKNVLAVKASFDRKGYNWIEVYPTKPLPMIGLVQLLDVWVWGGNFKYRLEVHLEDYRGYKHILNAGWLNYIGWRNIRLAIPKHIPQGEKYVPRLKTLRFVKFVLFAHPAERSDIFYVYFDRMQIQSDVYLGRFDGDDLVKEGFKSGWMPKQATLKSSNSKTTNPKTR